MNAEFVIGVDVGTGSVRAGIFDLNGTMVAQAQREIQIWKPQESFVEQSSEDIWESTSVSIRTALQNGKINPHEVIGISFDATCSLVALDASDKPITVSPTGNPHQNVIVWMDHRAIEQAERINRTKAKVLQFVGGRISPEMEPPKLLWIKEHLPATWNTAAKFLDLADFMTYRATGADVRSLCTTVCKWTYLGKENRWDEPFFKKIGLDELLTRKKIGTNILPMGAYIGNLTDRSAKELGLTPATKVAVGIIDAHAGGLGLLGIEFENVPKLSELEKFIALIGGTSSCHMAVSRTPRFIKGVWGPYYSAMVPGMWLTEGGQSATGSLLDFCIRENSKYDAVEEDARKAGMPVYQYLNAVVEKIKVSEGRGPEIARDLNILPDFIGNRSPRADPHSRGIISGLTLDDSVETLARKYYATIQAVAYGTRHIIETMKEHGYSINTIHACGGGTKNPVWLQEHADVTGCKIILPTESEAVLLGSSMLAAVGAGKYRTLTEAAVRMSSAGAIYSPERRVKKFHDAKYKVFLKMYQDLQEYRRMLAKV